MSPSPWPVPLCRWTIFFLLELSAGHADLQQAACATLELAEGPQVGFKLCEMGGEGECKEQVVLQLLC